MREKIFFSGYQLMCLAGRAKDECERRGFEWEEHFENIAEIVIKNNYSGNADMAKCEKEIFTYIEAIKEVQK